MEYRGLFLADIHVGAMDLAQTYLEIDYIGKVLKEYTKERLLDFIIIGGDFFDRQFYACDEFLQAAMKLMSHILESANVVRVVYGTNSHDSVQYGILNILATIGFPSCNFRIINHVTREEMLPGLEVLYIPEEYIFDKGRYYHEFLKDKDKYDYIFGHGTIYEAFHGRIKQESNSDMNRRKPPVFSTGELSYACKGDVLFGHYHVHTEMEGDVSYVGSLSRWEFGEEAEEKTDKGFFYLLCDNEKESYDKKFIINEKARKYVTISYGYKDSVFYSVEEMERVANALIGQQERLSIYRLRVVLNIPVGYENPEALINYMTNRFKEYKNIQLVFNHGYVERKKENGKESISDMPDECKVFLDKNVPEEDRVALFLKIKRGIEMDPNKIKKYLSFLNQTL